MMVFAGVFVSVEDRIAWKAIVFPLQPAKRMLSKYIVRILKVNKNQPDVYDVDNTKKGI